MQNSPGKNESLPATQSTTTQLRPTSQRSSTQPSKPTAKPGGAIGIGVCPRDALGSVPGMLWGLSPGMMLGSVPVLMAIQWGFRLARLRSMVPFCSCTQLLRF